MLDFSALVLGPAMASFGQPITVTPVASQPGAPTYPARGVYASKPVTFRSDDGAIHSTVQPTLGIRLSDYQVAPMQGDRVAMPQGAFEIVDVNPDGQGGADCDLRDIDADLATTDEDGA